MSHRAHRGHREGSGDEMLLEFFKTSAGVEAHGPVHVHVEAPTDLANLEQALIEFGSDVGIPTRYVFDGLTGMHDLWGGEEQALRFFGHFCPRLHGLSTVAYWLIEKEAHSEQFLAKVRHVTQVVLDVGVADHCSRV